jgi:thiamine-monophosphate kinase
MTDFEALGPGREFDLIRAITRDLPEHPDILVGPGDDAAVLRGGVVVSCDVSVEGVHFRREWLDAEEIGYRAAAVALSDLAAMAAQPSALFVSLVLTPTDYGDYALRVMHGVRRAADRAGAALAGGDTTRTNGPLTIDVTVVAYSDRPVLRSGAVQGDEVWVTGELGAAAAAVAAWTAGQQPDAAQRRAFAEPQARTREAQWLAQHMELHALIDLSDGLVADLRHVAQASNVGIVVRAADIPVHNAQHKHPDGLARALSGGDDYELCFTAPAGAVEPLRAGFQDEFGIALTRIGEVTTGSGVEVIGPNGKAMSFVTAGYDHFAERG